MKFKKRMWTMLLMQIKFLNVPKKILAMHSLAKTTRFSFQFFSTFLIISSSFCLCKHPFPEVALRTLTSFSNLFLGDLTQTAALLPILKFPKD